MKRRGKLSKYKGKKRGPKALYENMQKLYSTDDPPPMRRINIHVYPHQGVLLRKVKRRAGKLYSTQIREALDIYFQQMGYNYVRSKD